MLDISLIFNLMLDAEKLYKGDGQLKKEEVISNLKKIMKTDYQENELLIDNIIEFIIFLSVNQKMLKSINFKACSKFCCK